MVGYQCALSEFMGHARDPSEVLDRLREAGLLCKDADLEAVFSLLVAAYMEEAQYHMANWQKNLDYFESCQYESLLHTEKNQLGFRAGYKGPPGWPDGESRAQFWLPSKLAPYLSEEGRRLKEQHGSRR